MRLKQLRLLLSLSVCLTGLSWGAQDFKIDPAWSHVEFDVKNFGINTVEGNFKDFAGTVTYDDSDVTKSSVLVMVQAASINTGIEKRDKHLRTAEFFDTDKFPQLTFKSDSIVKKDNGYVLMGSLTIKGHTKDVELPFTFSVEKSAEGKSILRAQATGVIDRHDFGIDYGSNFSVGRQVHIRLHIQAI